MVAGGRRRPCALRGESTVPGRARAAALGLVFLAGVAVYLALARSGLLALLLDGEALRARIAGLGA